MAGPLPSEVQGEGEAYRAVGLELARVACLHRTMVDVLSERGRERALPGDAGAVVGDWVAVERPDGAAVPVVRKILTRRTAFARWSRASANPKVVAANVDALVTVVPLGQPIPRAQLARSVAAARASGAEPVIVLNKRDLATDPDADRAEAERFAPFTPVHVLSALDPAAPAALEHLLDGGRTIAFVGRSGAGKSTLANALLGITAVETGAVARSGAGRHTTTSRQLLPHHGGGCVLDMPGLLDLNVWASPDAVEAAFPEVTEAAAACRFADCSHGSEPGCAVRGRVASGALDGARVASYLQLLAEVHERGGRPRRRRSRRTTPG